MNTKLRYLLIALAVVCVANIGWRAWASRGRITIKASDAPLSTVMRSIEKQAGIRLRSNLPADTKVTLHVRKVPLLHALDVLAANVGANWNVAYFTAPDKQSIDAALATISAGTQAEGWKRWSLPAMRGMGEDEGNSDPRLEVWQPKAAATGSLHAYLEQASHVLSAQFWAPEQWNPAVSGGPKAGEIRKVLPKLAKAARGTSAEVFLLRGRPQPGQFAGREGGGAGSGAVRESSGGRRQGEGRSEEMMKVMEEREQARIERLPKDKRAEALAEAEARRQFFAELAKLSPEERRAKMEERMEQMMSDPAAVARMEAGSTRRGAMQTADQRAERARGYLERKRQQNN